MTDELLKRVAEIEGMSIATDRHGNETFYRPRPGGNATVQTISAWNPLTNGNDLVPLIVKYRMTIDFFQGQWTCIAHFSGGWRIGKVEHGHLPTAILLAIVEAHKDA